MKQVSEATKANWKRLNVDESKKELNKRANKRMSTKIIIPNELFENKDNIKIVSSIVESMSELKKNHSIKDLMYNFSLLFLRDNGLIDDQGNTKKASIKKILEDNKTSPIIEEIKSISLPTDEIDILGIIYQCLLTEGDKNEAGSYYTPNIVVQNMIKDINVKANQKIIDPCCGTGMFLLGVNAENPESIYGVDFDEIAVMISKVNLIVKYKNLDFIPNIYENDFIRNKIKEIENTKFDYIITNPPWGANLDDVDKKKFKSITSGESFSYVLYNAINMVAPNGKIQFLLPESFLNVKVHSDIRKYVLESMSFDELVKYPTSFSGVTTKYISIHLNNKNDKSDKINIYDFSDTYFENVADIMKNPNYVITINKEIDKEILNKVGKREYETLGNSTWGLGIVTGNNKEKVKQFKLDGYEEIYTGKEISDYKLLPCKNYVEYNRSNFQQVAPEEVYRANEKLVYKFISKKITFAYDNQKKLFLNSANILIPKLETMSIKTTMAFLNSELFQYLYIQKFGEIKILKGNLELLPLPKLSKQEDAEFEKLVDSVLDGNLESKEKIEEKIYALYNIDDKEKLHIEESINGKID